MTGGSSSHAAPPQAPTCVNWDDDMDDFMPPNHGLQHMMFLPLYTNLEPEKRERERQEVRQVMLHHLKHQLVLTGMAIWMTPCPQNHGLQHMMFVPPVHESTTRKERKGKSRGSSSHATLPAAPPSVNWGDDLDDFIT